MAKKTKKRSYGFLIFTVVYALLFLAGTYVGLQYLWTLWMPLKHPVRRIPLMPIWSG